MFESIPTYPDPGIGVRPHIYMYGKHIILTNRIHMYVHTRATIEGMITWK